MDNFYKFVDGIEQDPVYICDPNKSPCKGSEICYQPGGCFYTTDKDRALDPSTPLYMAESLIKVNEEESECQTIDVTVPEDIAIKIGENPGYILRKEEIHQCLQTSDQN